MESPNFPEVSSWVVAVASLVVITIGLGTGSAGWLAAFAAAGNVVFFHIRWLCYLLQS